jgi:hypothetical protein
MEFAFLCYPDQIPDFIGQVSYSFSSGIIKELEFMPDRPVPIRYQ